MKKRILACLLALVMLIGVLPVAMAAEAETDGTDGYEWIVSKSKEATALDANKESTITLSLPSAEEKLASDVVFVLDKSSCSKETAASAAQMFDDLQAEVKNNASKIQIGVVVFGGDAKVSYSLKSFPETEDGLNELKTALSTRPNDLMGGSNMHAGLLAAQEMLKGSATDNNRKYVILVSDGLTRLFTGSDGKTKDIYYQYSYLDKTGKNQVGTENGQIHPKNCVYFGMIGEWVNVRTQSESDSNYVIPYGSWDAYFSKVEAWVKADGDSYALDYETYGNDPTTKVKNNTTGEITDTNFKYIGHTDYEKHAMSVDRAVYEAYNSFTGMVDDGYRCYAVLPGTGTPFGSAFVGAMNQYAKNGNIDFTSIGKDILYAVSAGSTVVDKMGSEFKFGGLETITLKVGTETLTDSTISGNTITFAHDENAAAHVITYDPAEDAFTWTINENVSNFAPVQLSYKVQLDKPSTKPGDHMVPTNEYAKLNPQDSSGVEGMEQEFPKPEVTYTVDEQGNVVPGVEIFLPAFALTRDDHYSYLIGYADGTVRPNGKITRAEVATIFFRLLDDDTRAKYWSSKNDFSDVSADKWYNNAVSTLSNMGVIGGYADGTFRPDAPISRAEFAKIAVSFTQNNGSAVYNYFTDVKTTDWFAPYVTAAKDAGLIEGYSDGSFKPESKITRAEACAIVNRTLGRKPSKAHMKISDRIDWPDVQTTDWFYEAIMEATNSHTYQMGKRVETWNDKLPQRDWAALETGWANAYTGNGGEVR